MGGQSFTIYETPYYQLRAINRTDIENLRLWKNFNKQYFFHEEDISVNQQIEWYEGFKFRDDDNMFVVEEIVKGSKRSVGCMGYRVKNAVVDVYNIMRGQSSKDNKFSMSQAFLLMIAHASERERLPVTCTVLKNNPALSWYAINGFKTISDQGDSVLLQITNDFLKSKNIIVKVKK